MRKKTNCHSSQYTIIFLSRELRYLCFFIIPIIIPILFFAARLDCSFYNSDKSVNFDYKLNDFQQNFDVDSIYSFNYGLSKKNSDTTIVIVSWNIQQGRYVEKQIEYLKSLNPDILCLQEVDWNNIRTGKQNIIKIMSKKLQMNSCYSIEFIEVESKSRKKYKYIGEGGGVTGNAILSRTPLYNFQRIPLSKKYFDWENPEKIGKKIISREPRIGQRVAICASTKIKGKHIRIVSTHLEDKGGGIKGRVEQLGQIFNEVNSYLDNPIIIAGDFNTYAHGLALLILRSSNRDSLTKSKSWRQHEAEWLDQNIISKTIFFDPFNKKKDYTVRRSIFYHGKLDWILLSKFKVVEKGMSDIKYSDHRALWIKAKID